MFDHVGVQILSHGMKHNNNGIHRTSGGHLPLLLSPRFLDVKPPQRGSTLPEETSHSELQLARRYRLIDLQLEQGLGYDGTGCVLATLSILGYCWKSDAVYWAAVGRMLQSLAVRDKTG